MNRPTRQGAKGPDIRMRRWRAAATTTLALALSLAAAKGAPPPVSRREHGHRSARRNTLAFSFVSVSGERSMTNPHRRFWANEGAWPPPPPGVVAGGPNAAPSDPTALDHATLDAGPARRYVDLRGSWSTNEVTSNWDAPLVWVAAYLAEESGVADVERAASTGLHVQVQGSQP